MNLHRCECGLKDSTALLCLPTDLQVNAAPKRLVLPLLPLCALPHGRCLLCDSHASSITSSCSCCCLFSRLECPAGQQHYAADQPCSASTRSKCCIMQTAAPSGKIGCRRGHALQGVPLVRSQRPPGLSQRCLFMGAPELTYGLPAHSIQALSTVTPLCPYLSWFWQVAHSAQAPLQPSKTGI